MDEAANNASKHERALICVVDDDQQLNQVLCKMLRAEAFDVHSFGSAEEFLSWFKDHQSRCDLIVSDINMPGGSGYDLCREVRRLHTEERIPIILITGSDPNNEKATGIRAGADDFIQKPFPKGDFLAKVDSLLNIRAADLNKTRKLGRLTRFLSPAVARMLISDMPQELLKPHRVEVSVLFIDLRRFTSFAERAEPEEVLGVLERYYTAVGNAALRHNGTLGHLAGDGIMVFFNDPEPIQDHQRVAIQTALDIRAALETEKTLWNERRYNIDFGMGIAQGHATIGGIGFDRFWQYTVIGPVANLAARLCQSADGGQILVSQRFLGRMGATPCISEPIGNITLKGYSEPINAYSVLAID